MYIFHLGILCFYTVVILCNPGIIIRTVLSRSEPHTMIDPNVADYGSKPLELKPTPDPVPDTLMGEVVEEGPNYRNVRPRYLYHIPNIHS